MASGDTAMAAADPRVTRRGIVASAGIALAFLLAANLPWLLGERLAAIDRPLVNLDYLLVALLFARRRLVLALLLGLSAVEAVVGLASVYHMTPAGFLETSHFAGDVRWLSFAGTACVALAAVALAGAWFAGVTRALGARPVALPAVIAVGVAVVGLDIANGSFDALGPARLRLPVDVAGSGAVKLARSVIADARASRTATPDPAPDSPHRQLHALLDAYPDRSVLVLVAESWGYARDPELTRVVAAPLVALGDHGYDIRVGARAFKGATTAAELRVLCGLVGDYRVLLSAAAPPDCAPAAASAHGRPAVAVHAFRGTMFERATWWPRIGFSETLFEPELTARGVPRCGGPFAGSCDREALAVIRGQLAGPPRFVYFLTLNTHLPLHARTDVDPALATLCERDRIPADVCQLTAEQAALMAAVATMLRTLPVPPVVMITGDHSPPYGSLDARNAFDPALVPLVVGVPARS